MIGAHIIMMHYRYNGRSSYLWRVSLAAKLTCTIICEQFTLAYFTYSKKSAGYPGGYSDILIFSHIRRLGLFFGVQNSEFQYFLGFSEKLIFFGGMKILWIFFWGYHKIGLV